MARRAFLSSRLVTPDGIVPGCVLVEDGRIQSVERAGVAPPGYEVLEFGDDCILPGLVDTHVHINDPGRSEWEGFWTATRAAAAGGITTVVDMPLNCLPGTNSVEALWRKREAAAGNAWVDWMTWGGVVDDNADQIEPLVKAGVPGFKCFLVPPGVDGFTMVDEAQLRRALPSIARAKVPLLVHAELSPPIDAATANLEACDWSSYSTYLRSRPDESELDAIALMIDLCREYGVHIHIVHLSSADALELLRQARVEGLPISAETCPHYLYFSAEGIPGGATLLKCAPPIRSAGNRERLWQGLRNGLIDLVASDHSPCLPAMKKLDEGSFRSAWGGIASLSLGLSAMWARASSRDFSLCDVVQWMAQATASLAGIGDRKGKLAEGYDADLVIFDPDSVWKVTSDRLYFKHSVSAYVGELLRGVVKATFLRGSQVYADGAFAVCPLGMELCQ
jgi:allantoinase